MLCSVSVRTSVPEMNVTPRMMAKAGEGQAQLVRQEPLEGDLATSQVPIFLIWSRTESAVGEASSPTILPSPRKTTRSA